MSKSQYRRKYFRKRRRLTQRQIEKLRRNRRIRKEQQRSQQRKLYTEDQGLESRRKKRVVRNVPNENGAIAENTVSDALELLKNDPASRVWDFIHTSDLADKLLDHHGADFMIQLCRRPGDPPWVDYCTVLLQVKRSSGSRPHSHHRNRRVRVHFGKHPRVPLIAVNRRTPERLAKHLECYFSRLVKGKKLPLPPPPRKNP